MPAAPVLALGAAAGVPGSMGVVQGDGQIPYKPEAAATKKESAEHWIDRDPELKCYLPVEIARSKGKGQRATTMTCDSPGGRLNRYARARIVTYRAPPTHLESGSTSMRTPGDLR